MMFAIGNTRSKGISIVEVLIALGVLAIFLSFATPALRGASAKAELRAAVENLEFSIRTARYTARQFERDVLLNLNTDPLAERHSVSFTFPDGNAGFTSPLQDFQFSPEIRLVSDTSSIRFDRRGMLKLPVQVALVSRQDADVNQVLMIE